MKRKEELEKELFESTYYKSIAREVVRKRNKVQKEIKDLQKQIEELKDSKSKTQYEKLSQFEKKIIAEIDSMKYKEETYVKSHEYDGKLIKSLNSLLHFVYA